MPNPPKNISPVVMATGVLMHQGKVFIQKRPPSGVWARLWEFPGGRIKPGENSRQAVVREFMEETGFKVRVWEKITVVEYMHDTTYLVTMHCHLCDLAGENMEPTLTAATEYKWAAPNELNGLAFPEGHKRLMDFLNWG
ncbi:MAG: (deoxy)nucleoside triphosphate pyrophosphohydrolase [Thermodesulfobacteriota bacterium]|nr:(deoxy)nucleoside triphosphate pyrophosphohydrolase [Thermodesulfobacteriota bacterium]